MSLSSAVHPRKGSCWAAAPHRQSKLKKNTDFDSHDVTENFK